LAYRGKSSMVTELFDPENLADGGRGSTAQGFPAAPQELWEWGNWAAR
jgi:hypothetical protein